MSLDVSVIIPTYNRISMLEEALESVFSQEFDGVFEVIVVDDNSQDGTPEIVATKYPDVHLISLKQNLGHGSARNRGIEIAKGQYIAFLDSDDLWKPNYLQVQVEALKDQHRSIALSGYEIWQTGSDQRKSFTQKPDLKNHMSLMHKMLDYGNHYLWSGPSALVFPRYAFNEVGLFEERFRMGIDIDMYLRCLGAGFNTIFTELPVFIKREGLPDQLTNPKNLKAREKSVFSRVDKFYSLYGQQNHNLVPPIRNIHIENHLSFANDYFFVNHDPLNGLRLWAAAWQISPVGALLRLPAYVAKGITNWIKSRLKFILYYPSHKKAGTKKAILSLFFLGNIIQSLS